MTLAAGTPIGKYVVKKKLAEGGMAEIYLCASRGPEGFEKEVVIKRIRPFLASDPKFIEMFINEAQLASRLNHANIVQIFDFDKHEDTYYLAMEYVHGRSLWELKKKTKELMFPLPPTLVAHIGAEVARGLHYAHRLSHKGKPLGIVHRDVTPHNVLMSFDGAVKLTDFGIAKADTSVTAPGVLKGKFAYMSPEQARGETVDARTDVFALGIVLWEMLTGGRLFDADNEIAVLRSVQSSQIPPPSRINPDVPEKLSARILKALERDLSARYATAQELERELKQFVIEDSEHFEDTDVGGFLRKLFPEEATMVRGMSLSGSAVTPADEVPPPPREKTAVQSAAGSLPPRPANVDANTHVLPRPGAPKTAQMPSLKPKAQTASPADPQTDRDGTEDTTVRPTVQARSVRASSGSEPIAPAPKFDTSPTVNERPELDALDSPAPEPTQVVRAEPVSAAPPVVGDGASAPRPSPAPRAHTAAAPGVAPVSAGPSAPNIVPYAAVARNVLNAQKPKASSSRGLIVAGGVFLMGAAIAVAVGVRSARTAGVDPLPTTPIDPPELSAVDASTGVEVLAAVDARDSLNAVVADAGAAVAELADAGNTNAALARSPIVDAGVPFVVKPVVARRKGTLSLAVAPWAKVVIDGVGRGEVATPRQFLLDVGEHRIRLEHPRGNREQRVVIQAGQTTKVVVNMLGP